MTLTDHITTYVFLLHQFNKHIRRVSRKYLKQRGEPGLVDRVLAVHAGSRGFDSHRGHMSEQVFRSNRPGYPHPVSFELENSSIIVAVGDCSVTERRRWCPPYQTGKTVHGKTLQTQRRRTHGARCVRQWFRTAEPLEERRYENWNTHTHTYLKPYRRYTMLRTDRRTETDNTTTLEVTRLKYDPTSKVDVQQQMLGLACV